MRRLRKKRRFVLSGHSSFTYSRRGHLTFPAPVRLRPPIERWFVIPTPFCDAYLNSNHPVSSSVPAPSDLLDPRNSLDLPSENSHGLKLSPFPFINLGRWSVRSGRLESLRSRKADPGRRRNAGDRFFITVQIQSTSQRLPCFCGYLVARLGPGIPG